MAQEIECGFASVTGIALMRELFWVYSWFYSEPNPRTDWKLLGFQACPDFSTVLSWPTMWRGGKKNSCQQQLLDSNLKKHFTFLSSSAEVPSAWTVDEPWCIVGELYPRLKFSLSTISSSMDGGEQHSKWVDPEEKCNWMWQLLQTQASVAQSWWVVTFTVTWKEENLKLAMLGIPDWVSCMRTRAPQSILASKLRCHFLKVAQFFFSVISKGCHL